MCVHTMKPNPTSVALMIGWAVTGVILVASGASRDWGASLIIPPMATWAEVLIGGFLLIGSLLSLGPVFRPSRDLSLVWRLDELGMWLALGGWATYATIGLIEMPCAVVHWIVAATMATCAAVRIGCIRAERRRTEARLAREAAR